MTLTECSGSLVFLSLTQQIHYTSTKVSLFFLFFYSPVVFCDLDEENNNNVHELVHAALFSHNPEQSEPTNLTQTISLSTRVRTTMSPGRASHSFIQRWVSSEFHFFNNEPGWKTWWCVVSNHTHWISTGLTRPPYLFMCIKKKKKKKKINLKK